jgi:hypothetical protein
VRELLEGAHGAGNYAAAPAIRKEDGFRLKLHARA